MTEVLTIFCCGTAVNRNDVTAVTMLYHSCVTHRLILDGPGSAKTPYYEDKKRREDHGKKITDALLLKDTRGDNRTRNASFARRTSNKMTGKGTQDNIVLAMRELSAAQEKSTNNILPYDVINLIGWSRGGVTSIKLANAILADRHKWKKDVEVNVFTFDPVPGKLNYFHRPQEMTSDDLNRWRNASIRQLHHDLNSYHSIIQENISRWLAYALVKKDANFVCVVPNQNGVKDYEIYPMPGDHGAACTSDSRMPNELQIGLHLAQKFLEDRGTRFNDLANNIKKPRELIEIYSQVVMERRANGWNKEIPSSHRERIVYNPLGSHPFYLNEHHRELIMLHKPELWQFLQQYKPFPPRGNQNSTEQEMSNQIDKLNSDLMFYPRTKEALRKVLPVK